MQLDLGTPTKALHPVRWLAMLIALAVVGAMIAPLATVSAQTPTSTGHGFADYAPATSVFFVHANLDTRTDQGQLAGDLIQRAGLEQMIQDQTATNSIPANSQIALVVNSVPDASSLDVAEITVDPMAAADTLTQGGYAVMVSTDDAETFYRGLVASLTETASTGAGEVVESEYGGVTITSLKVSAGDSANEPMSVAQVGDVVVFGVHAEDLQPVIDTFNGDTPALSGDKTYQQLMDMLPTDVLARGYIDGPALLDTLEQQSPGALDSVPSETRAVGDAFTAFTFSAEQQGFRLETRSLPSGDPFAAISPLDGSFFDKVPASSVVAMNGSNIDSTGLVTLISLAFVSQMTGQDLAATPVANMDIASAQDQVFAQAESLLGFNIKTDLIDNLVGEFGLAVTVNDITADVPSIDAIIYSDVSNATAVQDVVSKVAFIVGAGLGNQTSVETIDVNGSRINSIDTSEVSGGGIDKAEFGLLGDRLVVSLGSGLDDYLNGPSQPMSQDANFQAVMQVMPSQYGTMTYVNMPVLLDLVTQASGAMASSTKDADPSCGDYASQAEAQAAYDADQFSNFLLDQNFDGRACEDYFAPAVASPVAASNPYANILGMGIATSQENGVNGSTTFILIGGE